MLRQTKTTLKELTAQYRGVLRHAFLTSVAVMGVVAVILLGFGIYNTVVGISKKTMYTKLLKDLNNKTFVQ